MKVVIKIGYYYAAIGLSLRHMVKKILENIGLDSFVLALTASILAAWYWPEPGVYKGFIDLESIANAGVSLIFFFYGLKLSTKELKAGLSNWRIHIVVQMITFLIFPLTILVLWRISGAPSNSLYWIGTFFLAALPSTVSSSVVMVSIARGNIPSAIFNASVSSLLGVFLTPMWMGFIITSSGGDYNLPQVIFKLAYQVLLPVALGVALHSKYGHIAMRNRDLLKLFDQSVILLIVYVSFCDSFVNKMFNHSSPVEIMLLGVAMMLLFFLIYGITLFISKVLGFCREDTITALFCASKKSLVHGTVMAKVLFTGVNGVGVIILPLMIFHTLQLVAASIIAKRYFHSMDRASKRE